MNIKLVNEKKYSTIPLIILLAFISIPLINIFYLCASGVVISDYPTHNLFASALWLSELTPELLSTLESYAHINAYLLYHITVKIVQFLIPGNYELSSTVVLLFANLSTILIVRALLRNFNKSISTLYYYLIDIISVTSVYFVGIGGILTGGTIYNSVGSPNVWHNPTTIFVRPFMLLAFYVFILIYEKLLDGKRPVPLLIIFSALLVLSAFAKPSFPIVLVPSIGILVAVTILKDIKVRFFTIGIPMLLSVIPLIAVLVWQYWYTSTYSSGIDTIFSFAPGFGRDPSTPLPLTFVVGATLSLFLLTGYTVLCLGFNKIKGESYYIVSLTASAIGWFQAYFLRQTASASGDFFWGYMLSIHLVSVMSIAMLLKHTKGWRLYVGLAIYAIQVLQGLRYFINIAYLGVLYLH